MKINDLQFFIELNNLYSLFGKTINLDYYKLYSDVGRKNNREEEDYDYTKNTDLYGIVLAAVMLIRENWSSIIFLSKENLYMVLNFMKFAKLLDIPRYLYDDFLGEYQKLDENYRKSR